MFTETVSRSLKASLLALSVTGALAGAAAAEQGAAQADRPGSQPGVVDQAAAQLAARSDAFAATTAGINVVPIRMAGSCPRAFMLQVNLGARSPGTLSYRIETLDGRTSQVFQARTAARDGGRFGARVDHMVALARLEEGAADPALVTFEAPAGAPQHEPDFFERLFGTAEAEDPAKGLLEQSFRVKVVAPNEVASGFDRVSVSCDDEELRYQTAATDGQRDDRDRPGRDRDTPDRDRGDRDRGDRGRGGGNAAGGPN